MQQQALVEIGVMDLGRREAALAQPLRHRDERRDALGEMRDRAVGLAVAHRRAVRPPRRVHQDDALVAEREPLVAAGRGVALHARAHAPRSSPLSAMNWRTAAIRSTRGANAP